MSFITANKSMTAYISEADPLKSLSGLSPCVEFYLELFSRWVWLKAFSFITYCKSHITDVSLNVGRKRQKLTKYFMEALCYRWKKFWDSSFAIQWEATLLCGASVGTQSASLTGKRVFWTIPEWQAVNVHSTVEQKWIQLPLWMTVICLSKLWWVSTIAVSAQWVLLREK